MLTEHGKFDLKVESIRWDLWSFCFVNFEFGLIHSTDNDDDVDEKKVEDDDDADDEVAGDHRKRE